MVAAREDADLILEYLVHEAMLVVDAARPAACQFVLERLGLADAGKGVTLHGLNEPDDALGHLAVFLDPPGEVLEPRLVKFQASQVLRRRECRLYAAWLPASVASWPHY